jgi:hypothetical protein
MFRLNDVAWTGDQCLTRRAVTLQMPLAVVLSLSRLPGTLVDGLVERLSGHVHPLSKLE